MSKTVKVTLDGKDFSVPALNIAQLEDLGDLLTGTNNSKVGLNILKLALHRADPKPDLADLSPTFDEVGKAVQDILKLSGLDPPKDPQAAAA